MMFGKKTRAWIFSGAVALGTAGFVPSAVLAADRDREEWIKYEDTPREVKRALDRERGNHEIKRIDHVVRNGKEFYRATIDTKGEDQVVRLDPNGKVLDRNSVEDVAVGNERRDVGNARDEERQVKYASLPTAVKTALDRERGNRELKSIYEVNRNGRIFYRAIVDERNGDRVVRVSEAGKVLGEEDVREVRTAGSTSGVRRGVEDDGDRIAFDRLPGEVKTVIGREAGPDRVRDVYRYDRRGQTIYEAEIEGGNGTRVVRVNENGRVVSDTDTTSEGRRSLSFDTLPGPVKTAIGREVPRDQVGRVVEVTQNGKTYYRARVDNGRDRDPTWITVDENGRRVSDFESRR